MTPLSLHNGAMGKMERHLSKQRRTVLSGVVTPFSSQEPQPPQEPEPSPGSTEAKDSPADRLPDAGSP